MTRYRILALTALIPLALGPDAAEAAPDCNNPAYRNAPICNKGEPGNKPKPVTKLGSIYPAYVVLTILYDPPGTGSEVDYGEGSSTGTQFSDQKNFKTGASLQVTAAGVTVGAGFKGGPISGTTFAVNKQKDMTLIVKATQDQMSHDSDVFYLWLNAAIDLSQTVDGTKASAVSIALTSKGGGSPLIVPVTAKELKDPSLLPKYKQDQLKGLSSSDYASILSLDRLDRGKSPADDTKRFIIQQKKLQLDGPDEAGDPVTGAGIDVTTRVTAGTTAGWSKSVSTSVGFSTGFSFFGVVDVVKVQGSVNFESDYQATTQKTVSTSQTAVVKLITSTVGFHDVIDVYYDTLVGSYVFVSETGASIPKDQASVSGKVTDHAGHAVANRVVDAKLSDGTTRQVVTNSRGVYRIFRAPKGPTTVSIGGTRASAAIAADHPAVANLQLAE